MPRFAARQSAGANRQPFNPAQPTVRPIGGSIIEFAPVVAIGAGLVVILADPSRNLVVSVLALGVVATLVAVLAVHRRVTRGLREALAAAEAEVATQTRIGRASQVERAQLEGQLLQAQKMEVIGQVASGLAHDFNNTLMVAGGYADLLNAEAATPNLRAYAEAITQGMERGTELTRQLLEFARPTASTIQPTDVRPVVSGLVPLIRRLLGSRIKVEVEIPEQPTIVRFDPCQLEQALINLAINARDAMPVGGRLTVVVNAGRSQLGDATRSRVSSRGALGVDIATRTVAAHRPEEFVEIAVRDSGCGIATEHMDRIFEPFFTTKREGHGSGLGLAMVSRFAAHAGGDVTVESSLGVGTTVAIRLPRAEPAERPLPRTTRRPQLPERDEPRTRRRGRAARLTAGFRA